MHSISKIKSNLCTYYYHTTLDVCVFEAYTHSHILVKYSLND